MVFLQNQFEDVMQKMVLAKTVRACNEFEGEVQKRKENIEHLSAEIVALEGEVQRLETQG